MSGVKISPNISKIEKKKNTLIFFGITSGKTDLNNPGGFLEVVRREFDFLCIFEISVIFQKSIKKGDQKVVSTINFLNEDGP